MLERASSGRSIEELGVCLGAPITKTTVMYGDIGVDRDGRPMLFTVTAGAPAKLIIIDIRDERIAETVEIPDISGAWGIKACRSGDVYIGGYNKGLLYRWRTAERKLECLGHPLSVDDPVLYPMVEGDRGVLYGGTYRSGSVYGYDPRTGGFTNFGRLAEGQDWVRSVAVDEAGGRLYAGVGSRAHLVELELASGVKRNVLPPGYEGITSVYDMKLVDGRLFAKKESAAEMFVYDVRTGTVVEALDRSTGAMVKDIPITSRGVSGLSPAGDYVYYTVGSILHEYDLHAKAFRSLEVDLGASAVCYGFVRLDEEGFPGYSLVGLAGNGGAVFKYNPETGRVRTVQPALPAEPVNIHELYGGTDGQLYATGFLPGNMARYRPEAGAWDKLDGIGQGEGLVMLGGKLYIGVYPSARIFEWDPASYKPGEANAFRPRLLFSLEKAVPDYPAQDRPFAMAAAEELGLLFVGTVPKNGLLGGALAVYAPERGGAPDVTPSPVKEQSIVSLVWHRGLLYGGTSVAGGQGAVPTATEAELFVWDPTERRLRLRVAPVPGARVIPALAVGLDGHVYGMADGVLFRFDPLTERVTAKARCFEEIAGEWRGARLHGGPDGQLYGSAAGCLFQVDPERMELTILATGVERSALDRDGRIYASQRTQLYVYDR